MQTKEKRTDQMSNCFKCTKNSDIAVITDDGHTICSDCDLYLCPLCYVGEAEYEMSNGDYCCRDCYADRADAAYEYYKELSFEER